MASRLGRPAEDAVSVEPPGQRLKEAGHQLCRDYPPSLDRMAARVKYGTYGGSNFDRDGLSVPSRSVVLNEAPSVLYWPSWAIVTATGLEASGLFPDLRKRRRRLP